MSLWSSLPLPAFPSNVMLDRIRPAFMPYSIMQGVDKEGRPFLAQKVMYEGNLRVGFIIERSDTEWEYGLLEHMDLWVSGLSTLPTLSVPTNEASLLTQEVQQIKREIDAVKQDLAQLHQVWAI